MQIHSVKLTFQDIQTKGTKTGSAKLAVLMGTVFIDKGEKVLNEKSGEFENDLETINFTTTLDNAPDLKSSIQSLVVEALTLKNLKIAKENGNLTHFIESVGATTDSKPSKTPKVIHSKAKKV